MYVAVLLVRCDWAIGFRSGTLGCYALAGAVALDLRVVLGEEPWLARSHGERWERYRNAVPRWLGPDSIPHNHRLMAHLITFTTARFDPANEPANPINPIAGQRVLAWLQDGLMNAGYRTTEPDTEDWGWYIDVADALGSYLVGASGDGESETAEIEWVIQIHRHRSLMDRLLGRNRLVADDPLLTCIEGIVRAEPSVSNVIVDRDA